MKRSLTLRSESLSDLTVDELASVAGGADHTTPLVACVSEAFSCAIYVPSDPTCLVLEVYSRLAC
jgi:hypothetical protein